MSVDKWTGLRLAQWPLPGWIECRGSRNAPAGVRKVPNLSIVEYCCSRRNFHEKIQLILEQQRSISTNARQRGVHQP